MFWTWVLSFLAGSKGATLPTPINRNSTQLSPTDAAAGMRLHSDGTIDATPNSSTSLSYSQDLGPWRLTGASGDYEAFMSTGTPNDFSGALTNTWLNLGTTREWFAQVLGTGIQDSNGTLSIRHATTLEVLAVASVSMYAEATP